MFSLLLLITSITAIVVFFAILILCGEIIIKAIIFLGLVTVIGMVALVVADIIEDTKNGRN